MKDIPKRPFSQCLSTIISPLFAEVRCPVDGWGPRKGKKGRHSCLWQGCLWNWGGRSGQRRQADSGLCSRRLAGPGPAFQEGLVLSRGCLLSSPSSWELSPWGCRQRPRGLQQPGPSPCVDQGNLNFSCAAFCRTWLGAAWPLCFCQTRLGQCEK